MRVEKFIRFFLVIRRRGANKRAGPGQSRSDPDMGIYVDARGKGNGRRNKAKGEIGGRDKWKGQRPEAKPKLKGSTCTQCAIGAIREKGD